MRPLRCGVPDLGAGFLPPAYRSLLVAASFILALPLAAAEMANTTAGAPGAAPRLWSASLRWENDTFGGTDRFYTDGAALALTHTGPGWLDPVADVLPWGKGRRTVGYDLTQLMMTPGDTRTVPPDPDDRPYAGILVAGLTLHVERPNSYNGLKLIAGVVGPWSLAEETQREVHRFVDSGQPQGWDYQLNNEFIFNLAYEHRHRFQLAGHREGWSVEALPIAGAWLGNMLTQGEFGGLLRAGYNVPPDFGSTLVRGMGHLPPPQWAERKGWKSDWGFSVHAGALVNLVLRDITLDGNTFEDSPSVGKKFFVPIFGAGMGVGNSRFQTSFSYVFWAEEFEGQPEHSKFGALTLSYIF